MYEARPRHIANLRSILHELTAGNRKTPSAKRLKATIIDAIEALSKDKGNCKSTAPSPGVSSRQPSAKPVDGHGSGSQEAEDLAQPTTSRPNSWTWEPETFIAEDDSDVDVITDEDNGGTMDETADNIEYGVFEDEVGEPGVDQEDVPIAASGDALERSRRVSEVFSGFTGNRGASVPQSTVETDYAGPNGKVLRVVDYLSNLARVTMVTVREISSYQNVLWISDVPKEGQHCYSRSWGRDENVPDDVWLDVRKCPEPVFPPVPKICEEWVDLNQLKVPDVRPVLKETISRPVMKIDPVTKEEVFDDVCIYNLRDREDVKAAWREYVEKKWLSWAQVYQKHQRVQKVFGALHSIYQEQQRLGEQYELIMGVGFLTWRQKGGKVVKRHLVIAKAALEFEAALGRFIVRAAPDGDQADVEFDMLEPESYPSNSESLLATGHSLRDNFWDRTTMDALLTAASNSLEEQGRGSYLPEAEKASMQGASEVPLIEFAPALILRKRSMKGLLYTLHDMRRQIEEGGEVPLHFAELCEMEGGGEGREGSSSGNGGEIPGHIYFPLPANEQQREIIRKLHSNAGVLVQGPPGTGKSQTIANLISHLLATGKRVLVTAKSPRALEVLGGKIPAPIQPLCISMLGSGTDERESLERSVSGILTRVNQRNDIADQRMMEALERKLTDARKDIAEAEGELLAIREKETFRHNVAGGTYSGTAASIAVELKKQEAGFSWLTDEIGKDDQLPLSEQEVTELARLLDRIDVATEVELAKYFPDVDKDIPSIDSLREAWHRINELSALFKAGDERLGSPDGIALAKAQPASVKALSDAVSKMVAEIESVRRRPKDWVNKAIKEVLQDLDTPWKELLRLTEERLKDVRHMAGKIQRVSVDLPAGTDLRRMRSDTSAIQSHLAAGGGMKRMGMFEHPVIKKHGEHIKLVTVDGQPPLSDMTTLQKLLAYLEVRIGLDEIWSFWAGHEMPPATPNFALQMAHVDEVVEALQHVLGLYDMRSQVRTAISSVVGLSQPQFAENGSMVTLMKTCHETAFLSELRTLSEGVRSEEGRVATVAARANSHPLCSDLLDAVKDKDADHYRVIVDRLRGVSRRFSDIKDKQSYLARLAVKAPRLSAILSSRQDEDLWRPRLRMLVKAWAWRRARSWLNEYEDNDGSHLERNLKRFEQAAMHALGDLAALKAWGHCFERMSREHQRHLETWQLAIRRLGKGTGKHAHRHRQDAQRHLNACKEAVPAWVMPLHRVFDTVQAAPKSFDVIIIDEASQSGYEALPLLYLAEKVIVVGDEKQISPDAVGIDRTHVANLMRSYLSDFDHRDSFDIETSLFAHGRIRFGNRITLREHFRCAPEIIRFSNELCYTADPLIPLKQCPPNRLKPLMPVHVSNGFREGNAQSVINRPEAEALVKQIVTCCEDTAYGGMSMGVIVLQGEAQAKLIEGMLLTRLGAEEMQERRIICGNPYSFQGDERDVIFLSMVAARGEGRIGAMTMEKDMRRFNVAASRAKEQMWLFHSVTTNDLSQECMRKKLLSHFYDTSVKTVAGIEVDTLRREAYEADRWREKAPTPFDSWFEVDVALDIASRGYSVLPQFEFANKRIDIVVQGGNAQLAVECDGDHWHGRDEFEADMQRQRMLERCNWVFFRIRECSYRADAEKALEPLWRMLEARGIFPVEAQGDVPPAGDSQTGDEDTFYQSARSDHDTEELACSSAEETEFVDDEEEEAESTRQALEGCPFNIREALNLKPVELVALIIEAIRSRPNQSCVRSALPTIILKNCQIVTRGMPRKSFERKVEARVAAMIREGQLVSYTSVNERLRLGWNI